MTWLQVERRVKECKGASAHNCSIKEVAVGDHLVQDGRHLALTLAVCLSAHQEQTHPHLQTTVPQQLVPTHTHTH